MRNLSNNHNLKLAIQKDGRLTTESLDLLKKVGLDFEIYQRELYSICQNFPLEIIFVRDDDIPNYVQMGKVDLGIVGQNLLYEQKYKVVEVFPLGFAHCSLVVAAPKGSEITSIKQLKDKTVASSYPRSAKDFFNKNGISVKILKISGSVEITPALGLADAIVDLTSTGSSLALNELNPICKIFDSQAVLIGNNKTPKNSLKAQKISSLLMRIKGVLAAKKYKYIMMNVPSKALPLIKNITPGLKSSTIMPLAEKDWLAVHAVVAEDKFWELVEKLKAMGAQGILVSPVEKIIF